MLFKVCEPFCFLFCKCSVHWPFMLANNVEDREFERGNVLIIKKTIQLLKQLRIVVRFIAFTTGNKAIYLSVRSCLRPIGI